MPCVNCAKIRAAILHGKMAEAAGLSVQALRERFGLEVIRAPTDMLAEPDAETDSTSAAEAVEPPRPKRTRKAG